MNRNNRLLVWVAAGLLSTLAGMGTAHAGAWTREQNEFYLQVGYTFAQATSSYDKFGCFYDWHAPKSCSVNPAKGTPFPGAIQKEHAFTFYSEYGLLPFLTTTLAWDARSISKDLGESVMDDNVRRDSRTGIPEVRVGLRGRILREPFILSIETVVAFPAQQEPLPSVGYDPLRQIPIGIGTIHATFWGHLGKSWNDHLPSKFGKYWQTYTNFALGFQYRDNFDNNFVFNLEWGNTFFQHLFVGLRYYGEKNTGNRVFQPIQGEPIEFGQNDQQRYAVGLGFTWAPHLFVNAEYSAPTGGTLSQLFQRISVSVATSY